MNIQTIIVGGIVLAVFLAIVITGIRNRIKGKSGCSCGCDACAMKDSCHSK